MYVKFYIYLIGLMVTTLFLTGCGQSEKPQGEVLAMVNSFQLTLDDFNEQLASEIKFNPEFSLTNSSRQNFLERIITKELLIQEAKRKNLDRDDAFVKSIERYWEATLIRNLMEEQGRKIDNKVVVSEEEINSFLAQSDASQAAGTKNKARQIVRQSLTEKKKSRLMDYWIEELKKDADININQELLVK